MSRRRRPRLLEPATWPFAVHLLLLLSAFVCTLTVQDVFDGSMAVWPVPIRTVVGTCWLVLCAAMFLQQVGFLVAAWKNER